MTDINYSCYLVQGRFSIQHIGNCTLRQTGHALRNCLAFNHIIVAAVHNQTLDFRRNWQNLVYTFTPLIACHVAVVTSWSVENLRDLLRRFTAQDQAGLFICGHGGLATLRTNTSHQSLSHRPNQGGAHKKRRNAHIDQSGNGPCRIIGVQRGIETTDAPWIFMTDADCRQTNPRSLRLAMHHALDEKADMITLLPVLSMQCFWERFLLPICAGILMIWFRPSRINDADKDHAYANGMFMMIHRDAYDEIGQHEAMAGSLMEDMDMARKIKQAGLRLVMTPTEGLFDVWMYNSGSALYWGWVRIFVGAFRSLPRLLAALVLLMNRGLGLTILTIVGWSLASDGYQPLAWVATAGLACQLVMTARYYTHINSKWWWGALYPIPCLMVAFILVRAMFILRPGAQILWRGTRYKLQS